MHRRPTRRRMRSLAALIVGALLFAALAQLGGSPRAATARQEATPPEQVTIAFGSELTTMDPPFFTSSNEETVYYAIFDTLVTRDAAGQIIPGLAESWQTLDDNTWEFKLRAGVKFHDGTDLTSEDVKFTIDRIIDGTMENPNISKLLTIKEVVAVDPLTVRIITSAPDALMLARMAGIVSWIVPKHYIEAHGATHFATNPIGTGPYKFVSWEKDKELVLEANPDYFLGAPAVKRIVFRPVPEPSTRLALLKSGDVDLIQNVPPDQADVISGEEGLELATTPSLRSMYLILRSDAAPTDDVRVRQAINYAIDKESLVNDILGGYGLVSQGQTMGKEYFGFNPDLAPYRYDPDKARALLAEAGYADGLTVKMLTPSGRYQEDRTIAEAVAGQLSEVGIQVELEAVEFGVYVTRKLERTIEPITLGAWSQPVFDADGVVFLLYRTDETWGVHYSNPRVDELAAQARTTIDQEARRAMYAEALQIIRDEAPVAFLHQLVDIYGRRVGAPIMPQPDETIVVQPKW
ncbi:MAG: peptide/nickel transport system substrate-binding protein [Thermomicrobiales bacterium]|nr:peptide/nickel transport system substrate-binding protein [Thermomicrobiales bacterium]